MVFVSLMVMDPVKRFCVVSAAVMEEEGVLEGGRGP